MARGHEVSKAGSLDLDSIAREVMAAQDENRQVVPLTSRYAALDNDSAYQVAALIHEQRLAQGFVPVGRKIGFTNPVTWVRYGVREPIWAHVYDRTVTMVPGGHVRCGLGRFAEPRIEPEIIVHFRTQPSSGSEPRDILDCIDWFAHGFEIVQSHYPDWVFRAPDTIADWALHATLMIGEPQDVSALGASLLRDQETFAVELSCDGAVRDRGKGSNVLGSPLLAIKHLLAVLAAQRGATPLGAGELVTTGTLTGAHRVHPGETWNTRLEGIALPNMTVAFEP